MQVLSWNLFHGRAKPAVKRSLFDEFAATIGAWPWDVALLQEVPPWWPRPLAERCGASMRMCLTSRNEPAWPRAALGRRWPELIRSGMGGANAILVRGEPIAEHRAQRLTWRPERRYVHGVRLADGSWACNVHASKADPRRHAAHDGARAAAAVRAWTVGSPRVVFGGDFNLRDARADGFEPLAGHWVDHVFGRGWTRVGACTPDRGPLSDHAPVLVELRG